MEVKHDGAGGGRVLLYTMNGADWTDRYPRVVEEARRIKVPAVIDAEVICTDLSRTWRSGSASR